MARFYVLSEILWQRKSIESRSKAKDFELRLFRSSVVDAICILFQIRTKIMAESNKREIDEEVPSDRVIKLENIDQMISCSVLKQLLNSQDVRDKRKLNSIIKTIIEEGNTEAFDLLVDCGYKIDVLSKNGQTPLHLAFYNCDSYKIEKSLVDLLFSCAGDKNFKDSIGLTHLHVACVFGNTDMVKKLIENKENVNACFRYQLTPLHFAVMHYNLEIVQLLLKNGVKVDAVDTMGRTPLHLAARVIDDPNKSYRRNDDLEILKCLLEHRFNIHMKDKDGNTPLLSIFQHFYADHEENLIWNHSLDTSTFDCENNDFEGLTARQRDKLTLLLKAGANITGRNKFGDTILHRIIASTAFMRTPTDLCNVNFDDTQHAEMVKQFFAVQQNFNINVKNQKGETPLQVAVACLSAKIVEILLNHKADIKSLRLDYFHYVMVPNFECVQNLIAIIESLSKEGFEMTVVNELPVLEFLIHNRDDCNCGDLTQYFDVRNYLEVLVHFGSASHINSIFKKVFKTSVINSTHCMEPMLMDILGYLNYIECGNFFIEEKVLNILNKTMRKSNFYMLPFKPDLKEIEKMKVTKLRSCKTVYEVMQKNPNLIYKYIKNEGFAFIKNFPEYQVIIKGHFTKSLVRNYVEKTTYDYLKTLMPHPMTRSCYKAIMKYLSNEDMLNVVKATLLLVMENIKQL